jgi:hypothetical protein
MTDVNAELKAATEESSARAAKLERQRHIALDPTKPVEERMRAFMVCDAAIWIRRMRRENLVDATPDKITVARRNAEVARLAREKAARAAAGIRGRAGARAISGPECGHCGEPFLRRGTSSYCCEPCRQRAKAFRRKLREAS